MYRRSAGNSLCSIQTWSCRTSIGKKKRRRRISGASSVTRLEVVPQRKLHASRRHEQAGVVGAGAGNAQIAAGQSRADRCRIEAGGVGGVIGLPREFQIAIFPDPPVFGYPRIDIEVAIATEVVAFARLTWIGQTNVTGGTCLAGTELATTVGAGVDGVGIIEELRVAGRVKVAAQLYGPRRYAVTFDLPVRRPARLKERERQACGRTVDSRKLPATQKRIRDPVDSVQHRLSTAEGKLVHSIDGQERMRVEVRDSPVVIGPPGI